MEAFSLLKYWRGGGGAGPGLLLTPSSSSDTTTTISTTAAAVAQTDNTTDSSSTSDDDDDGGDDGPFFDLEFTVPDESEDGQQNPNHTHPEEEEECDEGEGEGEFKFTLSPSSNDRAASVSPSDDLFFKGKIVEVDPSSSTESTANKPQFTASLLKSATKLRVFMSGLKKPKPDSSAPNPEPTKKNHHHQHQQRVKFKVEEVPIVSLFTRDHSSRVNKPQPQNETEESSPPSVSEEKRFSKEVVMHKYLKMVKPLYVRVSRRYGEKLAAEGGERIAETVVGKGQKQGNLPARLRVVCKHLGKSRSASSAVAASPPAAAAESSKRRDDSLLQQQDAIQGAILHCKRSFNASREFWFVHVLKQVVNLLSCHVL
ncbi:probable membrane-associated kinase regulator 2 isoform X2 [Lotus japonicus]|uniref:probable membrane-associated kinase regulator 2 isoform X2 n=1 Tax=Lotus japonicus TaxID=34305 RepID=UPI002583D3C4|nr:probable membrane-associated kinase regulator 2 isoform X2 [Lotus japonicus]